tara:strand:- start:378 stop:902 length:525 start_codon:yes stop_codon:yes gene_type:complete
MIDESLITEHVGTSFDITKVTEGDNTWSRLIFKDNSKHGLDNIEHHAKLFIGDSDCCFKPLYENVTWGNVLVIGLGLGVIPEYINKYKNPNVIDVLDNNQELIDHIDFINENINKINGDAYSYTPDKKYDIVIVDLHWGLEEVTNEMKNNLRDNYTPHLNEGGKIIMPIIKEVL